LVVVAELGGCAPPLVAMFPAVELVLKNWNVGGPEGTLPGTLNDISLYFWPLVDGVDVVRCPSHLACNTTGMTHNGEVQTIRSSCSLKFQSPGK
jgi:hypothetical protein